MELISGVLATFLLSAAWQTLVVAAMAALCAWLLRNLPARYLHAIWAVALAAAIALPLASSRSAWQSYRVPVRTETIERPPAPAPVPVAAAPERGVHVVGSAAWLWPLVTWVYLGLLSLRLGWLGVAWIRTSRLLRTARARHDRPRVDAIARDCAAAVGISPVPVLWSDAVTGPITFGARRPVILLPEQAGDWERADAGEPSRRHGVLASIIGHEMAHIRRRDFTFNLLYEAVLVPLAVHPAAWWIMRRLRAARELACDELVAERIVDAPSYVRSLVAVAGSLAGLSQPAYSMGILDADILEQRVARLLSRRAAPAGWLVLTATAAGLAVSAWAASSFALLPAAGEVSGNVLDPSGSMVPRAQVLIRDVRTGRREVSLTSETGSFRLPALPAGRYRLEVRQPGFRLHRTGEFTLNGGPAPRLNVVLEVGMVRESITVHGG